jgi:hypothetical protein
MLAKQTNAPNGKYKYLSALILVSGPLVFSIGIFAFGYNKISSFTLAQSEWNRYKKERNNYLDVRRARLNAEIYKSNLEQNKLEEANKYFSDLPAVMTSNNGMTLVNFGKIINGEPAQYSYQITIGQQVYNVQGTIKVEGNNLNYEDDYGKTNSEVLSAGEVRHQKNSADGTLTLQLITTKNNGNLSNLGDVKLFTFKYK